MSTPENMLVGEAAEKVIKEETLIGNPNDFIAQCQERMKTATPEEVDQILTDLEKFSQSPDRTIEVYTDPTLDTFCCGQVPAKTVTETGEIVDDPKKKTYLIGVPYVYVAGGASQQFLRGEIVHEQGHAKWTDFGRIDRFRTLATQQGYEPSELTSLDNCIEDPRMERLVGGPMHENVRKQLFEKNRLLIIPNIAEGIKGAEGKPKMTPPEQFKFILKLESLWALHEKELAGEQKSWSLDDLDPRVKEEFLKVEPSLKKITGDSIRPSMKVGAEVEKEIVDIIWPSYKKLIDEFPEEESEGGEGKEGKDGESKGESSKKLKKGKSSQNAQQPESDQPFDPNDPSSWPPEMQKIFQKIIDKHDKRLQQKAEKAKKDSENKGKDQKALEQAKNDLLQTKDGFEDPKLREKYNELKNEVQPVIHQLKRVFERFLPKVDEPQYDWGKKGIRFSVQRLVRRFGTGHEEPMGRRQTPEKNALILQLLVDVSGSMYAEQERIKNAVEACVAVCEAASGLNIHIEILASDDQNVGSVNEGEKYLIKSAKDEYTVKIKTKLISMLDPSGPFGQKGNQDADAIRAALPRLHRATQQFRGDTDRMGTLMVFVSDSTTESADTKAAAEEARNATPFEGTAITSEGDIPAKVKYHFGEDSIIPKSVQEFPAALQEILSRHISHLKQRD